MVASAAGGGRSDVRCWGWGWLGFPEYAYSTPHLIENLGDFESLIVGPTLGCALHAGALRCWGDAQAWEHKPRTEPARAFPLLISDVRAAAIGDGHLCVVSGDEGRVLCIGKNGAGQLGDGTWVDHDRPVIVRVK
jgi:hypothetical protein